MPSKRTTFRLDATTQVDTANVITFPDGTDGLDFFATIKLNPWVLKNSTKEYILATIVHEALHAYIDFKFQQYFQGQGGVTQQILANLFPIFWGSTGPYTNGGTPTNSHNIMATNLISVISNSLYSLNNVTMSAPMKDSIYRSLAWGGLYKTNVFMSLPNQASLIGINIAARDTAVGAGHSVGPFIIPSYPLDTFKFSSQSMGLKMPCK